MILAHDLNLLNHVHLFCIKSMHGALSPDAWHSVPWCIAPCPSMYATLFPASIFLLLHSAPPAPPPLHAKQNFKNLANLAKNVNSCKIIKGFLTKLARLARFLKFCFAKYDLHAGRTHNPKPAIRIYPEPAISPLQRATQ